MRFFLLELVGWCRSTMPNGRFFSLKKQPTFRTPSLVSLRNDVWETSARVTTQIWVVLLIDHAAWEICFNQSEVLPRSGYWRGISMKFLRLFLRCHFAGKPVVASRLRPLIFTNNSVSSFTSHKNQKRERAVRGSLRFSFLSEKTRTFNN